MHDSLSALTTLQRKRRPYNVSQRARGTDMTKTAQPMESKSAAAETMTAILQDRYGTSPADVLRLAHVDRPTVRHDHVLVPVAAASAGRATMHAMTGPP